MCIIIFSKDKNTYVYSSVNLERLDNLQATLLQVHVGVVLIVCCYAIFCNIIFKLYVVHAGFSLRIVIAGEQCKVTGELLQKREALSGNEQNLAGEFCVVDGEFSDLRCLMNTLSCDSNVFKTLSC